MHRTAHPLALHPLTPLSMWVLVHTVSRNLLMLLVQVPLERLMWFLMVPTLPAASQPLTHHGLQPLLVVVMLMQVVQVLVLVLLMMA